MNNAHKRGNNAPLRLNYASMRENNAHAKKIMHTCILKY